MSRRDRDDHNMENFSKGRRGERVRFDGRTRLGIRLGDRKR